MSREESEANLFDSMPFTDWPETNMRAVFDYLYNCRHTRTVSDTLISNLYRIRIPSEWKMVLKEFIVDWAPWSIGDLMQIASRIGVLPPPSVIGGGASCKFAWWGG